MTKLNATRRQFLRTASVVSGSVGAAAAPFALNMATLNAAVAQSAPDYKAIVCMFFYGGNDSSHMVLRTDSASFTEYTRLRNQGADPIALLAPAFPEPRARLIRRHGDEPSQLERALLADRIEALGREAREDPLGPAPVLRYFLRLRAQVIALRAAIWGAALAAPPAVRAARQPQRA
jgi:uncharacterized protein (DUF1501 family)